MTLIRQQRIWGEVRSLSHDTKDVSARAVLRLLDLNEDDQDRERMAAYFIESRGILQPHRVWGLGLRALIEGFLDQPLDSLEGHEWHVYVTGNAIFERLVKATGRRHVYEDAFHLKWFVEDVLSHGEVTLHTEYFSYPLAQSGHFFRQIGVSDGMIIEGSKALSLIQNIATIRAARSPSPLDYATYALWRLDTDGTPFDALRCLFELPVSSNSCPCLYWGWDDDSPLEAWVQQQAQLQNVDLSEMSPLQVERVIEMTQRLQGISSTALPPERRWLSQIESLETRRRLTSFTSRPREMWSLNPASPPSLRLEAHPSPHWGTPAPHVSIAKYVESMGYKRTCLTWSFVPDKWSRGEIWVVAR